MASIKPERFAGSSFAREAKHLCLPQFTSSILSFIPNTRAYFSKVDSRISSAFKILFICKMSECYADLAFH